MMNVKNMRSPRTGREVANQFIINDVDNNITVFQSYRSTIIEIDRNNFVIRVHEDWNYSPTTSKYRNKFMCDEGFYNLATKKDFEEYMKIGTYKNFTIIKTF